MTLVSSGLLAALAIVFTSTLATGQQRPKVKHEPVFPALPWNAASSRPVQPGTSQTFNIETAGPALNATTWTPIGPAALESGNGLESGRITGIAVDPSDSNTIYIASAGGGVWKTTNDGGSWVELTDNQETLAMGSIAIAPSDPLKIYAGTGEANNSLDSQHGDGILVSSDGGATWTLASANGAFDGNTIGQIAIDPMNEDIAYAAVGSDHIENGTPDTNTGIWKTTDGGVTWTNVTAAAAKTSTAPWTAVLVDDLNPSIIYAAVGDMFGSPANGVYRSMDGGTTWDRLKGPPNGTTTGRIALAGEWLPTAPVKAKIASTPYLLYVAIASAYTQANRSPLFYFGRSDDAEDPTPQFTNLTTNIPNFLGKQGWYDIAVGLDGNANDVYCAGTEADLSGADNIIASYDQGQDWIDISSDGVHTPHLDVHALVNNISSPDMLAGTDGGIWLGDPTTGTWTDLNSNLNTIQFQGIGLHPASATTVVGGSQDNGTELYTDNVVWTQTNGGDGGFAQFSQTMPSRCYAVYPVVSYGAAAFFERSDNGCTSGSFVAKTSGFVNTNGDSYPPFVVDRIDGNHLLIGLDRVYESTDGADSWTSISTPELSGFNSSGNHVDTVALSPANGTNPEVVYAATGGDFAISSQIFVSTNDGASWTEHDLPQCSNGGHYAAGCRVNQIVVDPNDPTGMTAFAVTSNFTGRNGGHVYWTTNGGATWTDIGAGLPDLPTWSVQVDTDANHTVYISNDTGVYSSPKPYTAWTPYGTGLPNAQGLDLEINSSLHILAAATHGRGAWEIDTP